VSSAAIARLLPYDVVSLNIGSTPSARDVPGVALHAIPVKPIDGFLDRFEAARARIMSAVAARASVSSERVPAASN